MTNKYYLRIDREQEVPYGFVLNTYNEILETDIPVDEDDYCTWLKEKENKNYRLKEIATGIGLFDYIEEYTPEPLPPAPPSETELLKQRIKLLENENADLLLDSVNKDIKIEQNETDIADLLLVIGGMQ